MVLKLIICIDTLLLSLASLFVTNFLKISIFNNIGPNLFTLEFHTHYFYITYTIYIYIYIDISMHRGISLRLSLFMAAILKNGCHFELPDRSACHLDQN